MNLQIESLKKHLQEVKYELVKAQKYHAATILRDMERTLDRLDLSIDKEEEDQSVIDKREELKRKLAQLSNKSKKV